jgi:hypothetical protein
MYPDHRSDPGLGSPPPRYPGTFLLAFREAIAGMSWQVLKWKGSLVECTDPEGHEQVIGLENLFRRCRQVERGDWPALIAEFLATLGSLDPGEQLPDSLDEVADRLLVRLGPPIRKAPEEAPVWAQTVEGTDLSVNLVVDYPNRMCYVTDKLVAESGRPGSRWLQVALDNMAARTPPDAFQVVDKETGLRVCGVADAYDSSRALLLDRLLPEAGEDGCFVALPGRDALFVLPVNRAALGQVHVLKVLADKNYQTAPYPISRGVYWVRDGVWRRFPVSIQGEQVSIEPPREFVEVLRRLSPHRNDGDGEDDAEPAEE